MTVVIKKISNIQFYYFQDRIKFQTKSKVVNTMIGRVDLHHDDLISARMNALVKHSIKLCEIQQHIDVSCFFKNKPALFDEKYLEFLRILYSLLKNNLFPEELDYIDKSMYTDHVHGTTEIEGNPLIPRDVSKILHERKTPSNEYDTNAFFEVYNYIPIKDFLKEYKGNIDEELVKNIHRILSNNLRINNRPMRMGDYRISQVIQISGDFDYPNYKLISTMMRYLFIEYNQHINKKLHPIEIAAWFHQKFEEIHPFQDVNGRVGREILNLMLKKNGYPEIYIDKNYKNKYYEALIEGNHGRFTPLIDFIIFRILSSILYLFTKTSIYDVITSSEMQSLFTKYFGEEISKYFFDLLKHYHETDEKP